MLDEGDIAESHCTVQSVVLGQLCAIPILFHNHLYAHGHLENSPWALNVVFRLVFQSHHQTTCHQKTCHCLKISPKLGTGDGTGEELGVGLRDGGLGVGEGVEIGVLLSGDEGLGDGE